MIPDLRHLGVVPLVRSAKAGWNLTQALGEGGFSDALRVIRTNLTFARPPETAPKVIVITSPSPKDGKSTVAASLAVSLTEVSRRVLLIDADMRRPTCHAVFGLPLSPGLSDLLSERPVAGAKHDQRATLEGFVRARGSAIGVLTAGRPVAHSSALLGSEAMKSVICEAREKYDWVIIDAPPALAVADAAILGSLVDGVALVCSADQTHIRDLRTVVSQIGSLGGRVLGVVLNRVDMVRHSYYYARSYGAYHGDDPDKTLSKTA